MSTTTDSDVLTKGVNQAQGTVVDGIASVIPHCASQASWLCVCDSAPSLESFRRLFQPFLISHRYEVRNSADKSSFMRQALRGAKGSKTEQPTRPRRRKKIPWAKCVHKTNKTMKTVVVESPA